MSGGWKRTGNEKTVLVSKFGSHTMYKSWGHLFDWILRTKDVV
jgi:hypothetical protein